MTTGKKPEKEKLSLEFKTKWCEMPNAKLLKGRAQIEYSDTVVPGLKFRVSAKAKAFDFMFTNPDTAKRDRYDLGTFPTFSLDETRDKARAARKLVEGSKDPNAIAAKERAAEVEAEAMDDPDLAINWDMDRLLAEYYRKHLNPPPAKNDAAASAPANDSVPTPPSDAPAPPPSFKKKSKKKGEEKKARKPLRSGDKVKALLTSHVTGKEKTGLTTAGQPGLGKLKVRDFAVAHMWQVLNPIDDRGAYIQTNRVFESLKRMMKFGVQQGCRPFNPLADHEPPNEENTGSRYLSLDEIKYLWLIIAKALIRSPKVQLIIKIMLVTGKRSNEICGIKRDEINWHETDPTKRALIIPAARVKGQENTVQEETVPLSKLAWKLFLEAARSSNSEYLFPNDEGDGPYVPQVLSKCIRLALDEAEGMPLGRFNMHKWTPHDIRRTVGAQLLNDDNNLPGIDRFIKYLVLNHASELKTNTSDKHYDPNKYLRKKRHGLVVWGDFVSRLVGEEDCFEEIPREAVVPLAA